MKKQEEMNGLLVDYLAGSDVHETIVKLSTQPEQEVSELLGQMQLEWDACECDEDGATPEQDAVMNLVLDKYSKKLLS